MNNETFVTDYLTWTIVSMICFLVGLSIAPIIGSWVLCTYFVVSLIWFAVVFLKRGSETE